MQCDHLARQRRFLRIIESRKHGVTVVELAAEGGCQKPGTPNSKPETSRMIVIEPNIVLSAT